MGRSRQAVRSREVTRRSAEDSIDRTRHAGIDDDPVIDAWSEGDFDGTTGQSNEVGAADFTALTSHMGFHNGQGHINTTEFLFGCTGRMPDIEVGLPNNLNRWYDAVVGAWIIQDPIGFEAGDANLYRYVGNGPTRWVDPSGLSAVGRGLVGLNRIIWGLLDGPGGLPADPYDSRGSELDERRRQHFLKRKYACEDDPLVKDMSLTEIRMMNADEAKDDISGLVEFKDAAKLGVLPGAPPGTTL